MSDDELAVTLSPSLFDRLAAEAHRLDLPLAWVVADLLVSALA